MYLVWPLETKLAQTSPALSTDKQGELSHLQSSALGAAPQFPITLRQCHGAEFIGTLCRIVLLFDMIDGAVRTVLSGYIFEQSGVYTLAWFAHTTFIGITGVLS